MGKLGIKARVVCFSMTMAISVAACSDGLPFEAEAREHLGDNAAPIASGVIDGEAWAIWSGMQASPAIGLYGAFGGGGADWPGGFEDRTGLDPRHLIAHNVGAHDATVYGIYGFGPPDMAFVELATESGARYVTRSIRNLAIPEVTFFAIIGPRDIPPGDRLRAIAADGSSMAADDR